MNIPRIKKDFTILRNNPELVYLDSAASSLTPDSVIDAMNGYYYSYNANIARGVYQLSEKATEEYENVRTKVASFINATSDTEIVFTSGTTASLNMIAFGLMQQLAPTDTIATTAAEHHANFIPWQRMVDADHFNIIDITPEGFIDMNDFVQKVTPTTKILTLSYVSNVLGTINPLKTLIAQAKKINPDIITVVDAAQAAPHIALDVQNLDSDFLAFSAHKMCGPTGVGVLWGKKEMLEKLTPLFTGGEMISEVTFTKTTFADVPHRLEAGTPNIAGVIGLGAAIDYLTMHDIAEIRAHEMHLTQYAYDALHKSHGDNITIFGPAKAEDRSSVVSFTFGNYHPHDIATILDTEAHVCVRAGSHCAMPLHTTLGAAATTRASFYLYNTEEDVDHFVSSLHTVKRLLSR